MTATVERVRAEAAPGLIPALSEILIDCVAGGASVSFMHPLELEEAQGFWTRVAGAVEFGATLLFVAFGDGRPVGTVQLLVAMPPNQPHRAELAKLLVHRSARRRGFARALLQAAEEEARRLGKTLITLDTALGGGAERLYEALGYQRVGAIPAYALMPDGRPCDTVFFYKML